MQNLPSLISAILHKNDPVLMTLTCVFSSNLKSDQNFEMMKLWHHNFCEVVIFTGPNTFGITIASECEPIRLPACILNRQLADSMA